MENLEAQIERKRGRLESLRGARSKANCSAHSSSAADLRRQEEIEELEEEISKLEKRLPA